jgi:hypothetical protein
MTVSKGKLAARAARPRKIALYVSPEHLAWLHQMASRASGYGTQPIVTIETLAAALLSATINEHRDLQQRGKAA